MKRIVNFKYNTNLIKLEQAIEDSEKIRHTFFKNNEDVDVCVIPVTDDNATGIFFADDENVTLKIKLLDENAKMPYRAHTTDIGADVYATSVEYDAELDRYIYHTGLSMEVPTGYGIHAYPRSSNTKTEAYLPNSVGNIDCGYRNEVLLIFKNRTPYKVECMIAEWEHMKKATNNIQLHDDANVGEAVGEMKANMAEPFVAPDPMDFAPYKVGERVCQLVVFKLLNTNIVQCDELSESERGTGGFGSTGK